MKYFKFATTCVALSLSADMSFARDFTIASWGGNYQDAQRAAYFEPFAKSSGLKLVETTYLGGLAELKAMADTKNVTWDLVLMGVADAQLACDEGLLEEIDWAYLDNGKGLIEGAVQPCAVGTVIIGSGFGYNSSALATAPQGWADFFDTAKFPGKRGMANRPITNLEAALMADGVSPDAVYSTLSTPEGVDRAFAKLDTLKGNIQFWDAGSQPVEWLLANNVTMSTGYNARIISAKVDGKPLEYVWNQQVLNLDTWAIPNGSSFKKEAMDFLKITNSPEAQAEFSKRMPYGPTNEATLDLLTEEQRKNLPAGKNNATALVSSHDFWIENLDHLRERWTNWAAQ